MEMKGYKPSDLARLLGSEAGAGDILDRRRRLTLEQAWKLHTQWRLPTDALIRPYPLRRA
jgi:HTH-type transcriptional regulator/antitoxin HigA